MAVPVISDLPSSPTRNDGAADFTTKADAMIGALQPPAQLLLPPTALLPQRPTALHK